MRGVVGDRVILDSTIRRELAARPEFPSLDAAQRTRVEQDLLRDMVRQELWVQIGKVIGREDPVTFEKRVDELVQEYLRDQQTQFGSFARMNQELEALGTSWQSLRTEQRQRILRDTARSYAIGSRFGDGFALLVSPREIETYFAEHPDQFVAFTAGDVSTLAFPKGRDGAAESAAEAAAVWATEELSAADLAPRCGGIAMREESQVRPDAPDDTRSELIKAVVRDHEPGAVIGPIDRGEVLIVLKLQKKVARPEESLTDLRIQTLIRNFLVTKRLESLEEDILMWKARQILVWPPGLFGR